MVTSPETNVSKQLMRTNDNVRSCSQSIELQMPLETIFRSLNLAPRGKQT